VQAWIENKMAEISCHYPSVDGETATIADDHFRQQAE